MAEKKQADEQAVQTEGGERLMERVEQTGDGEGVVVRGADDDAKDSMAAEEVRASGITNAPQHWDPETQTFSASEGDPFADNVDAANEAQTDPGPRVQNLGSKRGGKG
jgi:hypothetical protein